MFLFSFATETNKKEIISWLSKTNVTTLVFDSFSIKKTVTKEGAYVTVLRGA